MRRMFSGDFVPTLRFLGSRLLSGIVVLLGVSLLIFLLARVIPGNPARLALGPTATPAQVQALSDRLGLDEPVLIQYWEFLKNAAQRDFGISLYTNRPVSEDLRTAFPATLELVLVSITFITVFGLLLGILAAHYRDTAADNGLRLVSVLCVVSPTFVWAILLMLVFAFALGLFPIAGRLDPNATPPAHVTGLYIVDAALSGDWSTMRDAFHHIILPGLALSLPALGQTARLTRTNLVDAYESQYIELARAYSYTDFEIATRFALRPASIPTLTIIGLEFVALLGNAFLVESIFAWPGMARYGVQTILHKDLNGIVATVLVLAIFFVLVNTLVDLLVAYVNPRIRRQVRW